LERPRACSESPRRRVLVRNASMYVSELLKGIADIDV
jgi:hypothetical protein